MQEYLDLLGTIFKTGNQIKFIALNSWFEPRLMTYESRENTYSCLNSRMLSNINLAYFRNFDTEDGERFNIPLIPFFDKVDLEIPATLTMKSGRKVKAKCINGIDIVDEDGETYPIFDVEDIRMPSSQTEYIYVDRDRLDIGYKCASYGMVDERSCVAIISDTPVSIVDPYVTLGIPYSEISITQKIFSAKELTDLPKLSQVFHEYGQPSLVVTMTHCGMATVVDPFGEKYHIPMMHLTHRNEDFNDEYCNVPQIGSLFASKSDGTVYQNIMTNNGMVLLGKRYTSDSPNRIVFGVPVTENYKLVTAYELSDSYRFIGYEPCSLEYPDHINIEYDIKVVDDSDITLHEGDKVVLQNTSGITKCSSEISEIIGHEVTVSRVIDKRRFTITDSDDIFTVDMITGKRGSEVEVSRRSTVELSEQQSALPNTDVLLKSVITPDCSIIRAVLIDCDKNCRLTLSLEQRSIPQLSDVLYVGIPYSTQLCRTYGSPVVISNEMTISEMITAIEYDSDFIVMGIEAETYYGCNLLYERCVSGLNDMSNINYKYLFNSDRLYRFDINSGQVKFSVS